MKLSIEGIHNMLIDYANLLRPHILNALAGGCSPYDPEVAETIKQKAGNINTYIEGELPKFLIEGSEVCGVPLYAHAAALQGELYLDFLNQKILLGDVVSKEDYLAIYNETEMQIFRHQQRLAGIIQNYSKANRFLQTNAFINGLYTSFFYGSFL